MIDSGHDFPAFSLSAQDGKTYANADLNGSPSVVYFYPKDDTSGCTKEACEFRDRLSDIPGAKVFGVSPDGIKSHTKFAEKFNLNFPLLADEEKSLATALGIWVEKSMYGKKYMGIERTTYLLDADGKVAKVWRKVKPEGHAAEVMSALQAL
jgi:thioredoxin-dependent peroxiredoxin